MKRLLILLVVLALGKSALAQNRPFSSDRDAFFEELTVYLGSATSRADRAEAERLTNEFRGVWNNHYDDAEAAQAIGLYEILRSRTGNRAYYNIFSFTEVLLAAPYNGMTKADLDRFLAYTDHRFATRQTQLDRYLKACRDLFVDHVLGARGATQWVAPNASFTFPTDTACLFEVRQCDLILQSANDQSVIHDTRGSFNLETQLWTGRGGRVDWTRFSLPSSMVYGLVGDYQINLTTSNYEIGEITLYNKYYSERPCRCSFADAVTSAPPTERTLYPQAIPLGLDEEHGTLFGNVEYLGGIGMLGKSVSFVGTVEHPAQFVFRFNNRMAVRTLSKRFVLSDNTLNSNQVAARVYLYDTVANTIDSIYHNDLSFRYNDSRHTMLLFRKNNGVGTGPFHDSYHHYDLFLEAIYWNRDESQMIFRRLEGVGAESEGVIASESYFREADYLRIQALDMTHPMENMNRFLELYAGEDLRFDINDYANFVHYPVSQVLALMLNLQAEGYLEYDPDTQIVTVLPRFFTVLASDHKTFDYDVIKFRTKVVGRQPNALLMLRSNDLIVYGVRDYQSRVEDPSVTLSDFKHVLILPEDGRVVLQRNRDFKFSGRIVAGMYEFFTKECIFNYKAFSIEMNQVDSLRLRARFDGRVMPVQGVLERFNGTLEIDANDNKSSARETPEYPRFRSNGNAYCFYRHINGGAFDLELPEDTLTEADLEGKFYYRLDPFTVENIDDLNSEDIAYQGRLVSGGIFPDIVEPLVVMEDHSLGLRYVIGDGSTQSLSMFGGKGGFHQELQLSNEGFFGQGRLDVATSSFEAPRFNFYLDSVTASSQSFSMRENDGGVQFPKASCGPLDLKWDLAASQLTTTTLDESICLYDSIYFKGTTMITDDGFHGSGELTFGLTRFDAPDFDFESRSFVADSADFTLYEEDGRTVAFQANNYRTGVDFRSKRTSFEELGEDSHFDFPLNRLSCSLNQANWDMRTNNIHLSGAPSEFISLLPQYDSLSFLGTHADYDMDSYIVHAHGVASVCVADVEIVPWNQDVDIQRDATLCPLQHAIIVADTANRYYQFKDAAVSIYSRHEYAALGIKDYLDSEGVATPVFYDIIHPVDGVTEAQAEIPDSLDFKLSPWFGFRGRVSLKATEPFEEYKGDFRMEQVCGGDTVWFASKADIDPSAVSIPIDMRDVRRRSPSLISGLSYEFGSEVGYRVGFMRLTNPETVPVTLQNGELSYDEDRKEFLISDSLHSLALSDRCVVTLHNVSNLGFDEGLTQFACYGDFITYPNDSTTMEVLSLFNAPIFDDQVLADIANVYAMVEGDAIDLSQTPYLDYVRVTEGEEAAESLRREMELTPYPDDNESYRQTIVIPSLKMVWNPALRAYVSVGKIGLGSLGGHTVNRFVDGHVMFDRRLGMVIYYFENGMFQTYISYNFGDGQMQVHATYGTVNSRLSDLSERTRTHRSGNARFEYVVTPYEAMTDFLSRMRRAGLR